jgi:hypothetical protein
MVQPYVLLNCTYEAEWSSFQTHYFSENLVAPGIEPGTSGSVATEAVINFQIHKLFIDVKKLFNV